MITQSEIPLIYAEQKNPYPRPEQYGKPVLKETALKILPDILRWMNMNVDFNKEDAWDIIISEQADILDDLVTVLSNSDSDGYDMTKRLEDLGWYGDSALVELMDQASQYVYQIYQEHVKRWVKYNGVIPHKSVGDEVTITKSSKSFDAGTIVMVLPETAEYVIATEKYKKKTDYMERKEGIICSFEMVNN